MDLHLTLTGSGGLTRQLYDELRAAMGDGRLTGGDRLPPTRVLAARLSVSRNTVVEAYERLAAEGYVEGRAGSGVYVCAGGAEPAVVAASPVSLKPRPHWSAIPAPSADLVPLAFDFGVGTPDLGLFPGEAWRRLVAAELRTSNAAGYGAAQGDPRLRAAVARHVAVSRSVRCTADQVLISNGAQQAFDLIARVVIEPGETIAVENPGYPMAAQAFRAQGARIAPAPVDAEGLVVDALPDDARAVYVTPSHQFPLGAPMSLQRRRALLAWAARRGAAVVEDDYDSEFRFDGRPLEPLHRLDRDGVVIYVGSFSKVLSPALRLGYLVAPASLVPALAAAKDAGGGSGPPVLQGALARFIDEGLLARQIRRARTIYAGRRARLLRALAATPVLEAIPSVAGLHVGAVFAGKAPGLDAVCVRAAEAGVRVRSLSDFASAPLERDGLVFGYGCIEAGRIEAGFGLLARLLQTGA